MKEAQVQGESYYVIVLDPPKLAPSASGLDRFKRKYHGLNRDALKLINPEKGGLFDDVQLLGSHDAERWRTVLSQYGSTSSSYGRMAHNSLESQ